MKRHLRRKTVLNRAAAGVLYTARHLPGGIGVGTPGQRYRAGTFHSSGGGTRKGQVHLHLLRLNRQEDKTARRQIQAWEGGPAHAPPWVQEARPYRPHVQPGDSLHQMPYRGRAPALREAL